MKRRGSILISIALFLLAIIFFVSRFAILFSWFAYILFWALIITSIVFLFKSFYEKDTKSFFLTLPFIVGFIFYLFTELGFFGVGFFGSGGINDILIGILGLVSLILIPLIYNESYRNFRERRGKIWIYDLIIILLIIPFALLWQFGIPYIGFITLIIDTFLTLIK